MKRSFYKEALLTVWMMDSDSKQATRVLAAIVESVGRGLALSRRFQSLPEVEKVSFDFDCYKSYFEAASGSPYVFDWCVDVALKNGKAIWWTLSIAWDENKWLIETCVDLPGKYGPIVLKQFPDIFAETIDEFIQQLDAAASQLLDSSELIETQMLPALPL